MTTQAQSVASIMAQLKAASAAIAPVAHSPRVKASTPQVTSPAMHQTVARTPRPVTIKGSLSTAIDVARQLTGVTVELCGMWAWVTVRANQEANKAALTAVGYKWHSGKGRFYFAGCPARPKGKNTMDDVRAWHGSQIVKADD